MGRLFLFLLLYVIFVKPISVYGGVAKKVENGFQLLSLVTGYHSFLDFSPLTEIRIFEVNGSYNVAFNPINLYLTATSLSQENFNETVVVRLPPVSTINNVKTDAKNNRIVINAMLDKITNEGSILTNHFETIVYVYIKSSKLSIYNITYDIVNCISHNK